MLVGQCKLDLQDNRGRTALHWAVETNTSVDATFRIEELLIDNGANFNIIDKLKRSPIFYYFINFDDDFSDGVKEDNSEQLDPIELFSDFVSYDGIKLDFKDKFGASVLHYASFKGAFLCVSWLIKKGSLVK